MTQYEAALTSFIENPGLEKVFWNSENVRDLMELIIAAREKADQTTDQPPAAD